MCKSFARLATSLGVSLLLTIKCLDDSQVGDKPGVLAKLEVNSSRHGQQVKAAAESSVPAQAL